MKKLAILAMGLSVLLCSCGNNPVYKGLTEKKFTRDNMGTMETIIFREDNMTKYHDDWQDTRVYAITWSKEKILFEDKSSRYCVCVYYVRIDSYSCHMVGFFKDSKSFYPGNEYSVPYVCK